MQNIAASQYRRLMGAGWETLLASGQSPEVHLVKSTIIVPADPAPSDFAALEATFDTYAHLALGTLGGVFSNPDGSASILSIVLQWVLTADPTVGNSIYGYWIDALVSSVRTVMCWETFPAIQQMTKNGDSINLVSEFKLPGPGQCTLAS